MNKSFSIGDSQNEYLEEILHRKQHLQAYTKYQTFIESKQLVIDLESNEKRKYIRECQKLRSQMQSTKQMCTQETERLRELHKAQILTFKAQIAHLRTILGSTKVTLKEKELQRDNDRLKGELQMCLSEGSDRDAEITRLKNEKEVLNQQTLKARKELQDRQTKTNRGIQVTQKLELENQQLSHRIKMLRQGMNDQVASNVAIKLKLDQSLEQSERIKDKYEQTIAETQGLESRNREDNVKLERELALARRDIQHMSAEIQKLSRKEPWSQQNRKRRTSRDLQDPERMSPIHKEADSKIPFTERDHHCLCTRSEKYRNKLKEANDKIVELLADKCRRNIQTSFNTKTSKRNPNPNSTLDL